MPVVITDVAGIYPAATRAAALAQVERRDEIWAGRVARFNAHLAAVGGPELEGAPSVAGLYFEDPEAFPVTSVDDLPAALVTPGERYSLHLVEQLVERGAPMPKGVHITTGDAEADISKPTFLCAMGVPVAPELIGTAYDPIGILTRVRGLRKPSVSRIVEASASASAAFVDAVARIEDGTSECGIVVSSSAKLIPLPFETVAVGGGPTRHAVPFEDEASGHFAAEGGVGIVVRDEVAARRDGVPALARVAGYAYGTFGSSVVNRLVVADVTLRALAAAGLDPDTPVLVDLYGRGNRIDDGAELAAMEKVRERHPNLATAYLKGDRHYVVGSHGLQGLVRLLEARASGAPVSPLAAHPRSGLLDGRPVAHLAADPAAYEHVVFLGYSVHGSVVAFVLDLTDGAVGVRPAAPVIGMAAA